MMEEKDELGKIRRKKARNNEAALEEQEMLRKALAQLLEQHAYERLMIVKSQKPQLYAQAAQWIIVMAQKGALRSKIDEQALKVILHKISAPRHETKIEFRRKGESEGF